MAQTRLLRVPTKMTPVEGPIAMCRASGTTANNSIRKPSGRRMFCRFRRSASARRPSCGTVSNCAGDALVRNCCRRGRLSPPCTTGPGAGGLTAGLVSPGLAPPVCVGTRPGVAGRCSPCCAWTLPAPAASRIAAAASSLDFLDMFHPPHGLGCARRAGATLLGNFRLVALTMA
jgi:hypothetical protein